MLWHLTNLSLYVHSENEEFSDSLESRYSAPNSQAPRRTKVCQSGIFKFLILSYFNIVSRNFHYLQ